MSTSHPFIKYPSIAVFSIVTLLYFLGSLTPYINSQHFKPFTYLALFFPYLFIGIFIIQLVSFFLFRKYSLLFFFIILFGYKNIYSTIGFHYPEEFVQQKAPNTFRLLSWNVDNFVNCEKRFDSPKAFRKNIVAFIKSSNADILCFQDFMNIDESKSLISNLKCLKDTLHYPYFYFSKDDQLDKPNYYYGTIILSRYPITDSGRYAYARKHSPEHLIYATININGKLVRFYNTHLASMFLHKFGKQNYGNESFLQDDTAIIYRGHRYQKLVYFDSVHIAQAKLIKETLNKCTFPFLFCADLNSVPSSFVYQHISQGLNDAFLQKGFGWGGTYNELSPTLRIDVVLMSKDLKATQYYAPKLQKASDHYPIITDITLH